MQEKFSSIEAFGWGDLNHEGRKGEFKPKLQAPTSKLQ
jgi:hypothetical protein